MTVQNLCPGGRKLVENGNVDAHGWQHHGDDFSRCECKAAVADTLDPHFIERENGLGPLEMESLPESVKPYTRGAMEAVRALDMNDYDEGWDATSDKHCEEVATIITAHTLPEREMVVEALERIERATHRAHLGNKNHLIQVTTSVHTIAEAALRALKEE